MTGNASCRRAGANRKSSRLKARQALEGFAFVAPALILTLVFFIYPLINTVSLSFHDTNVVTGQMRNVGLKNYANLLRDSVFWKAAKNTTVYTLIVTPLIFIAAFILALLVNKDRPGVVFFRSVYFLPVVVSFVTASLIWKWMYNDLFGLINYMLMRVGLISRPVVWLGTETSAMLSVIAMVVWKTAGYSMVILLGGMKAIPNSVYEAASIDGASKWNTFWRITFPLLRPTFALALELSVIGSFLAFDHFYVMTQGGPAHSTETIVMWIYRNSFGYFKLGYGSAMSVVLLAFLVLLSTLQLKILRTDFEY